MKNNVVMECGNGFAGAVKPSKAKANCGSYLVKAWGASANNIAAELTMAMEAMGPQMGINGVLIKLQIDCDNFTRGQKPFKVIVEQTPQALKAALREDSRAGPAKTP